MNGFLDIAPPEPKPDYWYGLPHGYVRLDLQSTAEGLQEVARQIHELPSEVRDHAEQVLRLYTVVVAMLRKQQVQGCALGMHPDDNGGSSLSVLTVSTLPTPVANPKAALTQILSRTGTGPDNRIVPVTLPVGTGFLIESEQRTIAPIAPPEGQEAPPEETVWQGTVAIPNMASSAVITVQLVTPAIELSADYRGVLLGVARTVTLADPAVLTEGGVNSGPLFAPGAATGDSSPFG